ncbi:hypothetical protein NQ315_000535 [Exocentrus adspersus]|uniref:Zinc finger MYM-type protein 1 n=1 Tax=Exocentrus adspersus TaxID=1586481 RepID=A0AAV8VDE8_9CUCU|nr:hypothetical protein NQ315_000535 [Exocentrus adspersus]
MNKISDLKNSFSSFSLEKKLRIKELGRPTPDLKIEKQSGGQKSRCRKFNKTIYNKNTWLCGCEDTQKLFCFVCVLFGGDDTWSQKGTDDLVHIWNKMKNHETSKVYMNNVFSLSILGRSNIKTQLNSAYRDALMKHNDQVTKNRYVLNKIINCIKFCGAFELALRGHDEKEDSENRGIFKELVNFSAELDKDLKTHIENSKVFKGTSKTIQNEILECMLDVYHEKVKKEIENSPFVAVIADETTDVACEFQLVIIFRYLCKGRPVERFWKFYQPTNHQDSRFKTRLQDDSRKKEALEVCDAVLSQIKTRFSFSGYLVASNLFMSEKFSTYRREFPETFLNETCSQFSFLNKNQLKSELQVLYQRDELSTSSGAVPLSILLNEEGLNSTFQETLKLLSILITIPMTTSEAESCFSMLKRIKTFLRNTMKEERLSALGMLSAKKHFVSAIENFNNEVIENFATKKERRMDFIYRKL